MMLFKNLHWSVAHRILKSLSLDRKQVWGVLIIYCTITAANAILDGVSVVLLVGVFTGGMGNDTTNPLMQQMHGILEWLGVEPVMSVVIALIAGVFLLRLLFYSGILVFDGLISAKLRRLLQESVFHSYLKGDWSAMHSWRIGESVGVNTMEADIVVKYLTSVIKAVYFTVTTLIMVSLAIWISWEISLVMMFVSIPMLILLQWIFSVQSHLSARFAEARKEFAADITERLHGLLQIHVEKSGEYHCKYGLRQQEEMTSTQILLSYWQAGVGSYNILLPVVVLLGIYSWTFFIGVELSVYLELIAGVGVLGARISGQLNGAIASLGNLSRLSGSLHPVNKALEIPCIPHREDITEEISSISVEKLNFDFIGNQLLSGVNVVVQRTVPLVLKGESGSGKTTLVNLIAGLYFTNSGGIYYVGVTGKKYDSREYRAKIGYVTQDIYLFSGSFRENLISGLLISDDKIWVILEQLGAADFVQSAGGLDGVIAESGKSLSGGQRRRLGIARVLLRGVDILLFDEITSGLDSTNAKAIQDMVENISHQYVVVLISHDPWVPRKSIIHTL
jgi:ABC-type multidrug transport system fused ATPase/permease subunit